MDDLLLRELPEAALECTSALCAGVVLGDSGELLYPAGNHALAEAIAAAPRLRQAAASRFARQVTGSGAAAVHRDLGYIALCPVEAAHAPGIILFVGGRRASEAALAGALLAGLAKSTLPELQALAEGLPRHAAMDESFGGITIADASRADLPLIYVNRTFCTMTGYEPGQLIGHNCRLLQGDDRDQPGRARMAEALAAGGECTVEIRNYRRDGTPFDNQVKLIPVAGSGGRLTHYIGIQVDVSDRRALRELLGRQADEVKRVLDLSRAAGVLLDDQWRRVLFVNQAGAALFGCSAAELLKRSGPDLLGPSLRALGAAESWVRLSVTRADGCERQVEANWTATEWAGHALVLVTLVDVTEREETTAALKATRHLLDNAPDAVFWTRADGQFVYVNETAAQKLGYTREQLLRLSIPDIDTSAAADPRFWQHHWQHTRESPEYTRRTQLRRRDGVTFPVEVHGKLMDYQGQPLRASFVRDITEQLAAEERLRESRERLARAIEAAPFPIMIHDADGRVEPINRAWTEITGYTADDLPSVARWAELAYGDGAADALAGIEKLYSLDRAVDEGDFEIRCKDGRTRTWAFRSAPLDPAGPGARRVISIAMDVTVARAAERRLRQASRVLASTAEGAVITDAHGRITSVNRAFTDITGFQEAEVLGLTPRVLSSGRHEPDFYRRMWDSLLGTDHWQGEIWNRRKNGEIYPQWLTVNAVRDEDGELVNYAGVFADLTRVKRSEAELEHLANYDPLTDLPNRRLLVRHLELALERARCSNGQVAVLLCNVDRFKTINESLGHPIADRILCELADRLRSMKPAGAFLARPGGDEFALVLESGHRAVNPAPTAQRLVAVGADPIRIPDRQDVFAGLSVGISRFPDDGADSTTLLRNADAALHHAKATAQGSYGFYSPGLTEEARLRLSTETELRRAIEHGELVLHYQPLVSVTTGRVLGAEALVRWPRPDGSLVPPGRFIPLAEDTGLILPLGRWVLDEACRQARAWHAAGRHDLTMAVNVSARQFQSASFLNELDGALSRSGLDGRRLELEITETVLIEQVQAGGGTMDAVRDRGVRLAIDDFGTGYSSLAYLKRFAADKLKIDRTFVRDLPHDEGNAEIAATIIAMARNLRMQVVAEGVETAEQLAFLREQRCDVFQGYLVSPAVPGEDFLPLAKTTD